MTDDIDFPCPWIHEADEQCDERDFSAVDVLAGRDPASGLAGRANEVLHSWDGDPPLCPMCLLCALAACARQPDADLHSVLDHISAALYEQAGPVVGIAFDVLAWPGDSGRRARFKQLAVLLDERAPAPNADGGSLSTVH